MNTVKGQFVKSVTVVDPDTGNEVEVEIWKDPESGAMVGIDSSWLENYEGMYSPFNHGTFILLAARKPLGL